MIDKNFTIGVIGVCGANGNLIARILSQRGFQVVGTDIRSKDECKFIKSLDSYDIKVFHGEDLHDFFKSIDYLVPPMSLKKDNEIFKIAKNNNIKILELSDIINMFKCEKSVFAITGTNGKTTSTTLLKKIAYDNGIKPAEHDLEDMQGNAEFIPILQSRLDGDVGILEVGTFGVPGTIKRITDNVNLVSGLITNITPDHLKEGNFLDYAHVKGEFIQSLKGKQIIVNANDPTIMGLLKEFDYYGDLITFRVDGDISGIKQKECVCGETIDVKEIVSGSGYYFCKCGLTTPNTDYIATNIDLNNQNFDLFTPDGKISVLTSLKGIHNVYNITGVIIAAHEFLNLSFDKILPSIEKFTGVGGRMEFIKNIDGKDIIVDYAHNPAGVQTVLREFNKLYGDIATVVTISSESGQIGDEEIFESVCKFSKYVIPVSISSQKIAKKFLSQNPDLNKKIILEDIDENFIKDGTLGSTKEDVIKGIENALNLDCSKIIAIGEAAVKFKDYI